MKKLWDKGQSLDADIEAFTIGQDRELDLRLAPYDVLASKAHAQMLCKVGLLTQAEWQQLAPAFDVLYEEVQQPGFKLDEGVEDIHSQLEGMLTARLGEVGKKIHSGRSRNDQVLVALALYYRAAVNQLRANLAALVSSLLDAAEKHQGHLMPGYTHMQTAMPSSFAQWFAGHAENLLNDLEQSEGVLQYLGRNPLGSGAGYGTSFPLDRAFTAELLGFNGLHYNAIAAQYSRGKNERLLTQWLAELAHGLGRLAMDICLYNGQEFRFFVLPDAFTTGSSIMPHKKNPDVWELLRGHANRLQALPNEVRLLTSNLPTGYHREFQLLKEAVFPAIDRMEALLFIAKKGVEVLQVRPNILQDPLYQSVFTVEAVNARVLQGQSFRDAYRSVAAEVSDGTFSWKAELQHSHAGSIGDVGMDVLRKRLVASVDIEQSKAL
ncbi:MAG: argininosuccinate lyase [Sphingobacteriaceae bacterium]|nr:argininosuccinate lyase [Sphingobacteriaceae bacterium]